MKVFIAGVMQGTRPGKKIAAQDYRDHIAHLLRRHLDPVEILDPNQLHPEGEQYGREKAMQTFVEMCELASQADCLIAYLPEASMGTAVEMWQAYRAGVPVYTISPLSDNWTVFALSTVVLPDLGSFADFVAAGGLDRERQAA
ncbi:MAG: hypothetical protein JW900_00035 [Anaerolineae bacterium]|nr:hypothetical protein [Anaerolineae bacterium]